MLKTWIWNDDFAINGNYGIALIMNIYVSACVLCVLMCLC